MKFRDFLQTVPLSEMAYKSVPKSGKDWLVHMPSFVKNMICLASDPDPEDPDIEGMSSAYFWIMNWGLFEASRKRKAFVAEVVNPLFAKNNLPKVKEVEVFSNELRSKYPQIDWVDLDKIWFEKYEPKTIHAGDRVINIEKANEAIASIGVPEKGSYARDTGAFEQFHYGGPNGLMAFLEKTPGVKSDGEDLPNTTYKTELQGPDLSDARIETDVSGSFVRFFGLKNPNNPKIYYREIVSALQNTHKQLSDPRFPSKKKGDLSHSVKLLPYARKFSLDSTSSKIVNIDKQEDYENALKYLEQGLNHVMHDGVAGFTPEEKEWIIASVTGRTKTSWKQWFSMPPESRKLSPLPTEPPFQLKGQFAIPNKIPYRNIKTANVINYGVKKDQTNQEKQESLPIYKFSKNEINYADFASVQNYEPFGQPTDIQEIHKEYVENGDWVWNLSGKKLPKKAAGLTLEMGPKQLKLKKLNNGLFQLMKAGETTTPCNKNGCRIALSGNLALSTNSQEVRSSMPLSDEKQSEEILKDMFTNPEKYGDTKTNDGTYLGSIKTAIAKATASFNALGNIKKITDFESGDAINWGIEWMRRNLGHANFFYGPFEHQVPPKYKHAIINSLKRDTPLQTENPEQKDYVPPELLEELKKNGKLWRTNEMADSIRANLTTLASRQGSASQFGTMLGGEDKDSAYDPGDNTTHRLSDIATQIRGNALRRNRQYDPTIGGMVGVKSMTDIEPNLGADSVQQNSIHNLRIQSFSSLPKDQAIKAQNEYEYGYKKLADEFNPTRATVSGNDIGDELSSVYAAAARPFVEIFKTGLKMAQNKSFSIYQNLGTSDAIYDNLENFLKDAIKSNSTAMLKSVGAVSNLELKTLLSIEDSMPTKFYNHEEISGLLNTVKQKIGRSVAIPTPVAPVQSRPQIASPPKVIQGAGLRNFIKPTTPTEAPDQPHEMISFSRWKILKETEAIYDGTKPKDGCGFNWWGAVGKPGGVSITGDVPKRKKKKNGK